MPDTRSVWLATATMPQYGVLAADQFADVLVVGGGLIGLTTALLLQEDGAEVVLLEGGRIGARTSGSTTGKVTSQHGAIYARLLDRHGTDKARQYGAANQAAIEEVDNLIHRLAIDCELSRSPSFVYTTGSADLHRETAVAAKLGLPAHLADAEELGLPLPVTEVVRFDNQLLLHPGRYLAGLATAFSQAGGRIFEQSRVTKLQSKDDGIEADTESGRAVRASHAVVATLLPIGTVGGYFARTRPSRSNGIAVRLPVDAPAGMAISADQPVRSTRPWPGGGPGGLIVVGSDDEPADTEAKYQSLVDWASSVWNVSLEPEYRWSAHDYSTPDLLPYVGKAPGSPVLVATGMHKWGLSNGTVAAGILRDLVLGRDNPWTELYDASRIGDAHAVAHLVKDNLKVAKEFTVGRLHHRGPVCTHLGCPLHWNQADTTWDCECHGSRFASDGTVLDGPATSPLQHPTE